MYGSQNTDSATGVYVLRGQIWKSIGWNPITLILSIQCQLLRG